MSRKTFCASLYTLRVFCTLSVCSTARCGCPGHSVCLLVHSFCVSVHFHFMHRHAHNASLYTHCVPCTLNACLVHSECVPKHSPSVLVPCSNGFFCAGTAHPRGVRPPAVIVDNLSQLRSICWQYSGTVAIVGPSHHLAMAPAASVPEKGTGRTSQISFENSLFMKNVGDDTEE